MMRKPCTQNFRPHVPLPLLLLPLYPRAKKPFYKTLLAFPFYRMGSLENFQGID